MLFPFINPVSRAPATGKVVATDRPYGFGLGWSTMEDIQLLAAKIDMAGQTPVLVATRRPRYGDTVYDLYTV